MKRRKPVHDRFYETLPEITSFDQALDPSSFLPFPAEWSIVVTDVVNSTAAIEAGRYKEVNIAGALATMALANELTDMDFPFVFGGDGTTFVLPPSLLERARPILADTQRTVRNLFNLDLRVGIVPLADLYAMNLTVTVARFLVSPRYRQAILEGPGVEAAEHLVKDPQRGARYRITEADGEPGEASFSGFSCRWQDVPSERGETVALIVKPAPGQPTARVMQEVLSLLRLCLGDEQDYNPLATGPHALAPPEKTVAEAWVAARATGGLRVAIAHLMIRFQVLMVGMVMRLGLPLRAMGKNLAEVVDDNIRNSDFRKYDGTLKMVISCSHEEREKLEQGLRELSQEGRIQYGIHISDRAIITCLIHPNSPQEVHFVDAAGGGYALAAAQLKSSAAGSSGVTPPATESAQ
ncbi:MAG: DUF3095 domain-containing protein [Spirochaetaceae bacterium]|nr:MAG: DUF3095 domain-containing protein [Spirochaetaceae bacterium]